MHEELLIELRSLTDALPQVVFMSRDYQVDTLHDAVEAINKAIAILEKTNA